MKRDLLAREEKSSSPFSLFTSIFPKRSRIFSILLSLRLGRRAPARWNPHESIAVRAHDTSRARPVWLVKQAVRSLGRVSCTCYQASTSRLSTRCSSWDLNPHEEGGKTRLGSGFALRCFQRLSFLDVALQPWNWHPNWRTSGQAISVLSY